MKREMRVRWSSSASFSAASLSASTAAAAAAALTPLVRRRELPNSRASASFSWSRQHVTGSADKRIS